MNKQELLDTLYEKEKNSPNSPLFVDGNTNIVFGEGDTNAIAMFVGEAPGRDEDIQGRPFVGRAGKLFDKALATCNLKRSEIYITNIVKTRPTNNRTPTEEEIKRCWPILEEQINIIKPKIICTLGASAANAFLKQPIRITKMHGLAIPFKNMIIVPTLHPAYILRDPKKYPDFLGDLQFVSQLIKNLSK